MTQSEIIRKLGKELSEAFDDFKYTKNQIEKFAVGYAYPTNVVENILRKSDFDKDKAHEILCNDRKMVEDIWQNKN